MNLNVFKTRKPKDDLKPAAYVIENVHIITGDGKENFGNVVIKDDKIVEISAERREISHSKVIDGTGKTLMPGLIDSHMHIQGMTNKSEEESDAFLKNRVPGLLYGLLKSGVTTIKDLGAPATFIYKLRDKLNSKEITGPNLLIVGPDITAKGGHPAATLGRDNPWIRKELSREVENEQQARQTVKELAENKVNFIKIIYQGGKYTYFDKELVLNKLDIKLVNTIIEEAKKYNLKVTAHVQYEADVLDLLKTDIYGIEHGLTDKYISDGDPVMELLKSKGVYYVPTLQIFSYDHETDTFDHCMKNLKKLHDYGVKIALGTDNMLEGLSGDIVHRELEYYVAAGLTEMDALVTATHNSAEYLGILDRTGTVEEGKDADLILLDSDPLKEIQNIESINMVFKGGNIVYTKDDTKQAVLGDYTFPSLEALTYLDNSRMMSNNPIEKKYILDQFTDSGIIRLDDLENNNCIAQETFKSKKNLDILEWGYKKPLDGTDFKATAKDGSICLTGYFKKKAVSRKYRLNSSLWLQMGMFAFGPFIKSNEDKIDYFSIGSEGHGALSMMKFESKKEGAETISVDGRTYDCIKVGTVIANYSFIWKGYSWHDKRTGILVKFVTKGKEQNALSYKNT